MSQAAFARKGVTMIEVIIVLGIFSAVLATTLPFVGRFQQTETLETTVQDITQTLRRAQNRAVTNQRNMRWGVSIDSGSYILFAGNSYSTRDADFDEEHEFDGVYTLSGSGEVVFTQYHGTPVAPAFIQMTEIEAGTGTITIRTSGAIDTETLTIQE